MYYVCVLVMSPEECKLRILTLKQCHSVITQHFDVVWFQVRRGLFPGPQFEQTRLPELLTKLRDVYGADI